MEIPLQQQNKARQRAVSERYKKHIPQEFSSSGFYQTILCLPCMHKDLDEPTLRNFIRP